MLDGVATSSEASWVSVAFKDLWAEAVTVHGLSGLPVPEGSLEHQLFIRLLERGGSEGFLSNEAQRCLLVAEEPQEAGIFSLELPSSSTVDLSAFVEVLMFFENPEVESRVDITCELGRRISSFVEKLHR